jgi:hypothetical protein
MYQGYALATEEAEDNVFVKVSAADGTTTPGDMTSTTIHVLCCPAEPAPTGADAEAGATNSGGGGCRKSGSGIMLTPIAPGGGSFASINSFGIDALATPEEVRRGSQCDATRPNASRPEEFAVQRPKRSPSRNAR